MNRGAALAAAVVVAVAAVASRDLWKPHADAAFGVLRDRLGLAAPVSGHLGYVDVETTLIAPREPGRLAVLAVAAGQPVAAGDALFGLDTAQIDDQIRRQDAAIAAAEARLANMRTGRRDEEQAVTRAQRDEARAQLVLSEQELQRQKELLGKGVSARAAFDQAASSVVQLTARIASLDAQERVGALAARPQEIAAAEADVAAARASRDELVTRRTDLAPKAPKAGIVEQTFYDPGEWVGAGVPVVSIIAADGLRLRVFVPETEVAAYRPGGALRFTCDGCGARTATVMSIASRAEYTPPVIYSRDARSKFVFRVTARPDGDPASLRPGLPVEVARP